MTMSRDMNLMELGPNRLCAPGLRNAAVRRHVARMLECSGGHLLSLPFDHREEHGADKYYADGPLIPPPYPGCGMDPTVDALGCMESPGCQ
jgi:hypothetical protein